MSLDFNDLALRTIQSQYGASPHIIGIVEAAAKHLDPTGDIQTFFDMANLFILFLQKNAKILCRGTYFIRFGLGKPAFVLFCKAETHNISLHRAKPNT